jgi:hypothetical protein
MKLLTSSIAALLLTASTASAEVTVTIQDGLVTVVAKDVTIRQIIAEWARVGQAKVVNAERLPGGPVTLELTNMPEGMVLDTLLRGAAGYVAAPRPTMVAGLSTFDRVIVMPTSSAPRTVAAASPPVFQPPQFQQPQFQQPNAVDDQDDERPQPNGQLPAPSPRGPVFNTFPQQPQVINPQTGQPVTVPPQFPNQVPNQAAPQQQPMNSPVPTAPFGGVAVPGMVAPTPQQQQPGVINAPQQPGQIKRPGLPDERR